MKHNLKDTTFLIPLRIDHQDRLDNAHIVLNYLTKNFNTNIILYEDGLKSHWNEFKVEDDTDILYFFVYNEDKLFHRMKMLNDMLSLAKTKVVANYDIDCLLDIPVYLKIQKMIIEDGYEFLNPFSNGINKDKLEGVVYIDIDKKNKMIKNNFDSPSKIYKLDKLRTSKAGCGFVVFLNRISYLSLGGENEDFYAYGPEDKERFYRFYTLGYKINNLYDEKSNIFKFEPFVLQTKQLDNKVYHLEHYRTPNSSTKNKFFCNNESLFMKIKALSKDELFLKYYKNSNFDFKNYNNISNNNFTDNLLAYKHFIDNRSKYNTFPRKRAFLTMSKIGENGRLGNQMFQYCILLILSIKYNMEIRLKILKSDDKYKNFRLDELFNLDYKILENMNDIKCDINEKHYNFDKNYDSLIKNDNKLKEYLSKNKKYNIIYFKHSKKPYKCNICSMCFRKKVSIDNHVRSIHKKESNIRE